MTKKQIAALKRIAKRNRKGSVEYARTDMDGHTSFLVTDCCVVVVQYDTSIVDGEEIQNSNVPFDAGNDGYSRMVAGALLLQTPVGCCPGY